MREDFEVGAVEWKYYMNCNIQFPLRKCKQDAVNFYLCCCYFLCLVFTYMEKSTDLKRNIRNLACLDDKIYVPFFLCSFVDTVLVVAVFETEFCRFFFSFMTLTCGTSRPVLPVAFLKVFLK